MVNVKETLEEAADKKYGLSDRYSKDRLAFIEGAKYQAERMYSEEDMIEFSKFCQTDEFELRSVNKSLLEEFEKFKKK